MGPVLYTFLSKKKEISQTDYIQNPSEEFRFYFEQFVQKIFKQTHLTDQQLLIQLMDEFVTMNFPKLVLLLAETNKSLLPESDFHISFILAVSAMLLKDNSLAITMFQQANRQQPQEPAPYINLAKIFLSQGNTKEAENYCLEGFFYEKENKSLWEIYGQLVYKRYDIESAREHLQQRLQETHSWVGASLAEHFQAITLEEQLKLYQNLFEKGEKNSGFISEYTAILGYAGKFKKICQIKSQLSDQHSLHWQTKMHFLQALLTESESTESAEITKELLNDPHVPKEVKSQIQSF